MTSIHDIIAEQGALVRTLKQKSIQEETNWQIDPLVLDAIWTLLHTKYHSQDSVIMQDCGEYPKIMKIRWRVVTPEGEVSERFQNIFRDTIELTGQDVVDSISRYSRKKYPNIDGYTKIELIVKKRDEDGLLVEKTFREINIDSLIKMPLFFPGPVLDKEGIFEFRVHYPGKAYHLTTPTLYNNIVPQLVDTGTNLYYKEFDETFDLIMKRAFSSGVTNMALISVDIPSIEKNLVHSKKYENTFWVIAGIHPTTVEKFPPTKENFAALRTIIEKNLHSIKAIGECGLDSVKITQENKDEIIQNQMLWFQYQIDLSIEFGLPLFLHERELHDECIVILRETVDKHPEIVLIVNCFSGTNQQLENFLSLTENIYFVITGLLCSETRGEELREVIKNIPLERLLIASDAPYLIPYSMPKPFPKRNEPGFIPHVLTLIAEVLQIEYTELASQLTTNSFRSFNVPQNSFYSGEVNNAREIVYQEVQQLEAERFGKKKGTQKVLVAATERVYSYVNGLVKKKFVVQDRLFGTLSKQGDLSPDQFLDFALRLEAREIPYDAITIRKNKKKRTTNV